MNKRTNENTQLTLEPECLHALKLDRTSPLSLGRQLYLSLYEAISSGALPAGSVLPATRMLASRLGIARNTVVAAYSQLADEGLVTSKGGRTTRVIHAQPSEICKKTVHSSMAVAPGLSQRASSLHSLEHHRKLAPGEPDSSLFPAREWQRAMSKAARLPAETLGYRTQGQANLQISIARHLAVFRSLIVDPARIILTSSTRQSLLLAATLYADEGDSVLMESPGYPGAVDAFRTQGMRLTGCTVDSAGACPPRTSKSAKLAYLTPCFHYPLGWPLTTERRHAFLTLSRENGTVLFEDDYDSEFRDQSQPHPALAAQALQQGACVLHAGTFSKLVFPAARVAWLVVPQAHVANAWQCLRTLGGGHGVLVQTAICELLDSGVISRHLQRARQIYAQRRLVLNELVNKSEHIASMDGGGLTAVLTLNKTCSIKQLELELANAQLGSVPLERFDWQQGARRKTRQLVIGMGNVDSMALPATIRKLEHVLNRC